MLNIHKIKARDLPDLWFQAVYDILDQGTRFVIDRGSYAGQPRLEYDFFMGHVTHPGTTPLIPDIPPMPDMPPIPDMPLIPGMPLYTLIVVGPMPDMPSMALAAPAKPVAATAATTTPISRFICRSPRIGRWW